MDLKEFHILWNQMHQFYIKTGIDHRNEMMADWLEEQILKAKEAYYKTDEVIMEDAVYDKMEEYLRIIRPESIVLIKVGV